VKVIFEMDDENEAEIVEQDVLLDSHEAKEIRTVLSFKPKSVRLESPYSRNLHDPVQTLFVPEEAKAEPGVDSIVTVDAVATELAVIVDDLDEGFSTVKLDGEERSRVSDASKDEDDIEEYPRFRGFWPPRRWREQVADGAYGNYERTRKIKRAGDGNEQAIWSATLPQPGTYEVYFFKGRTSRDRYLVTVENGESTRDIELVLEDAKDGWNSLGKYKFEAGARARVILSDEVPGGSRRSRIDADAVKWVYQEPSDAVE